MRDVEDTRSPMAVDPSLRHRPTLVAVWPGGAASVVLPPRGTVVIGRGTECDLRIVHTSVSA